MRSVLVDRNPATQPMSFHRPVLPLPKFLSLVWSRSCVFLLAIRYIMAYVCLTTFAMIYLHSISTSLAAPTSSATLLPTPHPTPDLVGFVGDPNGRGTISLVISCLLTLLLCVWSALHLNVPRQEEPLLAHFWVNIRWIITGVYAPELVVFTAWRQWSSAKILGDLVKDLHGSEKWQIRALSDNWTMTHGFFASIGGFAYEIQHKNMDSDLPLFLPIDGTGPTRLTLTARGMALLVRCGHIPDVSQAEIADKSKANDIAKALVSSRPHGC